jgi:hypothetical protein
MVSGSQMPNQMISVIYIWISLLPPQNGAHIIAPLRDPTHPIPTQTHDFGESWQHVKHQLQQFLTSEVNPK